MKQLMCELCNSIDLVKQDGLFVCQHCGCKYTLEEARKMMVEGVVEVQGTVKVDNSASIQNYLDIGENALSAGNGKQAEAYANKALEIDPRNPKAWRLKMLSYEHTATLGELQIDDMCAAGINVIEYSQDRAAAEQEVYSYYLNRAMTLIQIATAKLKDVEELKRNVKMFMAISILTAPQNAAKADKPIVEICENVATSAVLLLNYIPDTALESFEGMAHRITEFANAYQKETQALEARFMNYGTSLTESAKKIRSDMVAALEKRAMKGKLAYLAAHSPQAGDKLSLLKTLEAKKAELEQQRENVEGGAQLKEAQEKSRALMKEKNALGFFQSKERKALEKEITHWDNVAGHLVRDVKERKAAITEQIRDVEKQIAALTEEMNQME